MVCPGDACIISIQEESPLTLQVGMIANDGILLAGDVWTYVNENQEPKIWHGEPISKVGIYEGMAITRAHDLQQAKMVSDAIAKELLRESWHEPEREIERIAKKALEQQVTWRGGSLPNISYRTAFPVQTRMWRRSTIRPKRLHLHTLIGICLCWGLPQSRNVLGDALFRIWQRLGSLKNFLQSHLKLLSMQYM